MEKGIKKGDREGKDAKKGESGKGENSGGNGEEMNGELYEIFKEQMLIRQMLEDQLKDLKGKNKGVGENALKQMEQLEKEILEKGFSNEVLARMQNLKYELMKLEEASYKQGEDSRKVSRTNDERFEPRKIRSVDYSKLWFIDKELLIRQSLPLRPNYKIRVQNYFKYNDSIQ